MIAWLASLAGAAPDPAVIGRDAAAEPSARLVGVLPRGGPADRSGYGPDGALVVLRPTLDGVEMDGTIRVRLGPDGAVRSVRRPPSPERVVRGVGIPVESALAAAGARVPLVAPTVRERWSTVCGALRRVWVVEGGAPTSTLAVPRVWVDAVSGGVLRVDDAATDAVTEPIPHAWAYPSNPVLDSAPSLVELPLATAALSDDQLEVVQCRDLGEVATWDDGSTTYSYRICTPGSPNGPIGGDWLFDPIPYPVDPARDEDDFVAPQVYWNVHQGLDWFTSLGWVSLPDFDPRLVVTTNYRTTDWATEDSATLPTSALEPYDNAYSSGGYEDFYGEWSPPVLVFGQGASSDFGYDADVIHHELGHFVVHSNAGPSFSVDTIYGPSLDANALNEGLADYFSAAFHERPRLGDYAVGLYDPELVRDLSGLATCSADQYGEPHWDSLPFSQGLWAARSSVADPAAFDRVVLDSLAQIGEVTTKADAVDVILAETSSQLGQGPVDALTAAWDERGMLDCEPILDVTPSDAPFRPYGLVPGSYWYATLGEEPAYLQYRVEVPEAGTLTLRFSQYEDTGADPFDDPPAPLGVVGRAGEHIHWDLVDTEVDTTFSGYQFSLTVTDWQSSADRIGDAAEVGTHPHEDDPRYVVHDYELAWPVEAGAFVIQLVNEHEQEAIARDLILEFTPPPPPETTPDPSGTTPTSSPPDKGGCGCASGGTSGGIGWWLVALWVSARGTRSRRRSRRRA